MSARGRVGLQAHALPFVEIDGIRVHAVTQVQCVRYVAEQLQQGCGGWLLTLNVDHLRLRAVDPEFALLCGGATLCVADGMPLVWASRLQRTPLPERVAGADLVSALAAAAEQLGFSIFLLGGTPGTSDVAAVHLQRSYPRLRLAGSWCPPFGFETDDAELDRMLAAVETARPDLVFLALSKPIQERLAMHLRRRLPHSWLVGVGIGLGFLVGEVRRAPRWMRRAGLEWTYRLSQEPQRLAARYLVHGLPYAARLFSGALAARRRA